MTEETQIPTSRSRAPRKARQTFRCRTRSAAFASSRCSAAAGWGDAAKAEPLFREALEKLTRFLGPDNLDVSEILSTQGRNFQRLGRFADAEGPLRRSLAIRVANLSADSQDTARTRLILGAVLAKQKKYAEAEDVLRLSEDAFRKKEGPTGSNTQEAIQAQVDMYRSCGKTEKAAQLAAGLTAAKP